MVAFFQTGDELAAEDAAEDVVLRNRPFKVLHFENLSRFVFGVDGGFHVG